MMQWLLRKGNLHDQSCAELLCKRKLKLIFNSRKFGGTKKKSWEYLYLHWTGQLILSVYVDVIKMMNRNESLAPLRTRLSKKIEDEDITPQVDQGYLTFMQSTV